MRLTMGMTLLLALAAPGCSRDLDAVGDDTGTDHLVDDDTGDPDDDSDTDDDTEPDTEDACAAELTPLAPGHDGLPECISEEISCGDPDVVSTTEGGSTYYGDAHSTLWGCMGPNGAGSDWSASERVYDVVVPAESTATVTLYVDCGDLFLRIIRSDDECPPDNHDKSCIWGTLDNATQTRSYTLINQTAFDHRYEVIVDGEDGFEGNFTLGYDCH